MSLTAGTRVKVVAPMSVPIDSTWDDDNQRTSRAVKRRLQQLFFKGDRRIHAAVQYVISETDRARLKRDNQVKIEVRDAAGSSIVITAPTDKLKAVA
ncbi:MAG: hypothetical protein JXO22_09935 [Phycisphaerae bacterium]|nr:hypothetical protein [Phycisphaerae bacterium]